MLATTRLASMIAALRASGLESHEILRGQEVQPRAYLLQAAGAELGYRFSWEAMGPYSEDLARDLAEFDHGEIDESQLAQADCHDALATFATLARIPDGLDFSREVWLRLLACVLFLDRRGRPELLNGSRPPLLCHFSERAIGLAKKRLAALS